MRSRKWKYWAETLAWKKVHLWVSTKVDFHVLNFCWWEYIAAGAHASFFAVFRVLLPLSLLSILTRSERRITGRLELKDWFHLTSQHCVRSIKSTLLIHSHAFLFSTASKIFNLSKPTTMTLKVENGIWSMIHSFLVFHNLLLPTYMLKFLFLSHPQIQLNVTSRFYFSDSLPERVREE